MQKRGRQVESMAVKMKEEEKIMAGILFCPADPELKAIKLKTHNLNVDYNQTHEDETEKRAEILSQIIGEFGEGGFIQGPIAFHYGRHTRIGRNFFGNFNLTVQASERNAKLTAVGEKTRLCYARPVRVGDNCWLGAGVTICPGVTIGDNCVIGAGSVVTRDIPENSFAAGVPCRVVREITDADSMRHRPEILADNRVIPEQDD